MTAITTGEQVVIRIGDPDGDIDAAAAGTDATVARVGSTGIAAIEPLVSVSREGRTAFHARCSTDQLVAVVSDLDGDADVTSGDPDAVVDHDPETTRLPQPDLPGLDVGTRTVLGACGWRRPAEPADHEAASGFVNPASGTVLDAGAGLCGRGWGDWCQDEPVGPTWKSVRDHEGDAAVVVNGHSTPADALVLASAPFEALDGATALADAVGADRVVVYASSEDDRAVETVREAVKQYPDAPVPVEVVTGPPEYRAAEPTMALEAIEGNHRLEARLRPPGPDEVGLHDDPTLVHTPRTLAHLAVALRESDSEGGDGTDGDGGDGTDSEAPGDVGDTRVLTLSGDVAAPATVEVAETATLAEASEAVEVDGAFKAACVGGRFGGVTRDLEVAVDPGTLDEDDLGTEGTVQILAEDRCVVAFVGEQARFAAEENCGRCVPCREGTAQLADMLREVYDGDYEPAGIEELVRVMATSSICQFGVDAGRPTRTALAEFDAEFAAHADGRCPAGSCPESMEVT